MPALCHSLARRKSTMPKTCVKTLKCGQPTPDTHPHLLKTGEVVPYIKISEFQDRRQNLIDLIHYNSKKDEEIKANLVIVPSSSKKYMSDKIPYVFRQNTDYLYLSGCLEPDSCLVLNTQESTNHNSILFVRNPDNHSELWDGPRTSAEAALNLFGVNHALPMSDLPAFLHSYTSSSKKSAIWYDVTETIQPSVDKIVSELIRDSNNVQVESPRRFIHNLRLFKSPAEIKLMKKSCEIASEAINRTIAFSNTGMSEHQIFAKVDYECRMNGAEYLAYPPVVAGGDRATIIHYINNNQVVADGEMVLMDAGCEYHGYSSDITRTWPINGTYSSKQRLLYEIIESVQSDLLNIIHTYPTLDHLFDSMCGFLGKKLQEAGLISRSASAESVFKTAYQFCPHHCSHYLGMDVHDTSLISRGSRLQPGMIITVEPGIYINDRHNVPSEFHGIGIRIEDDVLITEDGPVILTKNCVRNINDIENLMTSRDRKSVV